MTREIRHIPPAPRQVRPRAVLWHWWPFAFLGFVFGVYGGLITGMFFLAYGGKPADDKLLDAGSVTAYAVITEVEGGAGRPIRPRYRFTPRGADESLNSRAFLEQPDLAVGKVIQVEYIEGQPNINRPVGGRIAMVPPLHRYSVWIFLTGVLCFAVWLCAVLRLRHLMIHGDIATGQIQRAERVAVIVPTMLRVEYSFRDRNAKLRAAAHWVRARSALGVRVLSDPDRIGVLLSRRGAGVSRLVMADDFVVELAESDDAGDTHHE